MKLQDLQSDFQRIVLNEECIGANWVRNTSPNLLPQDRLSIYHNAYRVRLTEVIEDTFEHTAVYLGDEWFRRLASAYVQSHPSVYTNIGLYGESFSAFLNEQLPGDGDVAELANMDWLLRRAFDGRDSESMSLEDLAVLASKESSECHFELVSTFKRVFHQFNTIEIWHAIDQDTVPPTSARLPESAEIAIWRKGYSPHFRSLSPIESFAIDCVEKGLSLNKIGDELQERFPELDVSTECGVIIQRWIGDEMLRR